MMRLAALLMGVTLAATLREQTEMNPIRRVVNILQKMQEEIKTEGEKDQEMAEAFQCYCRNGAGKLSKAVDEEMAAAKEQAAAADEKSARVEQLKQEVKQHKKDRADAKANIEKATTIRNKEKKEFQKNSGDQDANVKAITKAVKVLEGGMGFMQVSKVAISEIQRSVDVSNALSDVERSTITAFLSSPYGDYQASSGEIVGILKAMGDEGLKDYNAMVEAEENAQKNYVELVKAKEEEIEAATVAIEKKSVRAGELAVEATEAKNAAENAANEAESNRKFAANLEENCKKEKEAFDVRQKERNQEALAVSEAVKILSDDDALDIFKKTMKSPATPPGGAGASFMQTETRPEESQRRKAIALVQGVAAISQKPGRLSLLSYMLRVGKVDFSKVVKMIDEMVAVLGQEQKDDDDQLNFCSSEFDSAADEKRTLERNIKDLNAQIETLESSMVTLKEEMATIKQEMEDSAEQAKEATKLRKEENAQFKEDEIMMTAAKQLIEKAKNRLMKFYNPAMYKPPPQRELTEEERIAQNMGEVIPTEAPQMIAGTNIPLNLQQKVDIGDAPEVGSYEKKSGKSGGVTGLMDMLVKELDAEFQTMQHDEKVAQRDYEQLMEDTKTQAQENTKSLTQKENQFGEAETTCNEAKTSRGDNNAQLEAVNEKVASLHKECDFLTENFDFRKTARTKEIEGLKNAKSVLAGADYA